MSQPVEIRGYCPACGHGSLIVRPVFNGMAPATVECCWPDCPDKFAAHKILQDAQTEHVVTFTADGFTLKHPVRERINDDLLQCGVHRWITNHEPEVGPGTYRVILDGPGSFVEYEEISRD